MTRADSYSYILGTSFFFTDFMISLTLCVQRDTSILKCSIFFLVGGNYLGLTLKRSSLPGGTDDSYSESNSFKFTDDLAL